MKQSSARPGRPEANPETARSKRVVTFVTASELTALLAIADAEDRSLSAVCHRLLKEALDNRTNPPSVETRR